MQPSFLGSLKNIGIGLFKRTAAFAGYGAASPTATTAQGSRIGTNPNSTYASVQRVGMQFTAEMVAKNSAIGAAYLAQRVNYCSSVIDYVPHTGDTGLDREIRSYLQGEDGVSGYFGSMGVDCSMQDAFSRTADIETPVRGDAGLIFWRDSLDNLRLIEFSADQLGEVYNFTMPRACSLSRDAEGMLYECSGSDCIYFAGRYFRGADCVAYKIYERTNAWYGSPRIYDADDVIYFRDPASFRGVRGVTKFANALLHMQKGEDMLQAALSSAQRQARTAGRVFNNSGGPADGYGSEIMTGDPALGGNTIKYFEREPGGPMIEYFYNGDSAEFINPSAPGPELIAGVEVNDERVAIALGFSYTFLINGGKTSGAIARLDIEKSTKELNRIQRTIHRPRLNTIRDRVLLDALRKGDIKKPFGMPRSLFLRGHWQLPVPPNVDAFYDVQENIAMVRAGMEAPQDIIAETNRNWEDVITKTTQWAAKASMARQDANATLAKTISPITGQPYKPDIKAADIAQVTDNPAQQPAPETQPNANPQQQPNAQGTAAMAAPHDVSHEKRDASGKWTTGGGGDSKEEEHHRSPSDFRAFKVQKISKESVLEHLKKHGWKPGDTLEHEKGHAEIYNPKPYNNIEGEHNGHTVDVAWRPKVGKPNEFRLYLDKGVKIPAPALQYQSKLIPSIVHERPNPMLSVAPKLASNSTDATAAMTAPHDVSHEKRDASGKWTSGGGGAKKETNKEPKSAESHFQSFVEQSGLDFDTKKIHSEAVSRALSQMPDSVKSTLVSKVKKVFFYKDAQDLTFDVIKSMSKNEKKNFVFSGMMGGSFNTKDGSLRLDGAQQKKEGGVDAHKIYAHEFGHACDYDLSTKTWSSDSHEWQDAYNSEIKTGALTKYAATTSKEGFAEFARFCWTESKSVAKKEFPKSYAVFEKLGLI